MTLAEFLNCNEDLKLFAALSCYLSQEDGIPLTNSDRSICHDYMTGGVLVEETSPYSTTVEAHAEGWVEL